MQRPLAGIRVVDFTWWRAGPWATRILACLGAEVIKVEWPQMPLAYYRDRVSERQVPDGVTPALNNNPFFSENSAGKRSITVNLRTPRGLDVVRAADSGFRRCCGKLQRGPARAAGTELRGDARAQA